MTKDQASSYEVLAFEEQCKIFFESSLSERGDLLLRSQDPARLASAVSREELYLMTRGMDMESRGELLRYASLPQLVFLSDLDCWQGEELSTKGFISWLEVLEAAGRERLSEWLSQTDYEILVGGFKRLIRVYKPLTEFGHEFPADEVLGDTPYFSLDHLYYVCTTDENFETVQNALEVLFEDARARYVNLLEGVISELDYEMEETALDRRLNRLAERGFPRREEAMSIYRPMSLEEWHTLHKKGADFKSGLPLSELPHYPVLSAKKPLFLDTVFAFFGEEPASVRDAIYEEFVWLSNKVLACEGIYLSSEERVKLGVERVRQVVSLALELLSGRDPAKGLAFLKTHWVEHIFRLGFTRVLSARDRALGLRDRYWKGQGTGLLRFLDPPYAGLLAGLLRAQPQHFVSDGNAPDDPYRDFRSLDEIQAAEDTLAALDDFHAVLKRHFPNIFDVLALKRAGGCEGTLLATLVPTVFANFVVKGAFSYFELPQTNARAFLKAAFDQSSRPACLKAPVVERFLSVFLAREDSARVRSMIQEGLAQLEAEVGGLAPSGKIDPRFISTLWLKP